jgi:hypothetical protein
MTTLTKILPYGINERIDIKSFSTGTVNHDVSFSSIFYHNNIASSFAVNLINLPTDNNRSHVIVVILEQSNPAYFVNDLYINSTLQTIKWFADDVPVGSANLIDVISFTLLRITNTWKIFAHSVYYPI